MHPGTKDDDASDTPLADTVDVELPGAGDVADEIEETGEPSGGNLA